MSTGVVNVLWTYATGGWQNEHGCGERAMDLCYRWLKNLVQVRHLYNKTTFTNSLRWINIIFVHNTFRMLQMVAFIKFVYVWNKRNLESNVYYFQIYQLRHQTIFSDIWTLRSNDSFRYTIPVIKWFYQIYQPYHQTILSDKPTLSSNDSNSYTNPVIKRFFQIYNPCHQMILSDMPTIPSNDPFRYTSSVIKRF